MMFLKPFLSPQWEKTIDQLNFLCIVLLLLLFSNIFLIFLSQEDGSWLGLAETPQEPMNPRIFQIMTLGYVQVGVDYLYMTALQDTIISKETASKRIPFYYTLDLATTLDPAFYDAYYVGSILLAIVRRDYQGAQNLLDKANLFIEKTLPSYSSSFIEKFWPETWYLYLLQGYINMFELNNLPFAAKAFQKSAQSKNAPAFLQRLADLFKTIKGAYTLGFRALDFMIERAPSDLAKKELEKKKLDLFISQFVMETELEFRQFLKKNPRFVVDQDYPVEKIRQFFNEFLRETGTKQKDPWGGVLSINDQGKLVTSTVYELPLNFQSMSFDELEIETEGE